jgi:hypothetical protein
MTARLIAAGFIACLGVAATVESGQSRYEAIARSDVTGVAGLRIINIRDNVLRTCYAVFLADSTDSDAASRTEVTELRGAATARDQRLGDLLSAFEQDRSVFAGTIAPNPLKYEWQANTLQVDFALAALNNMFARLEQDLLRAPRTAMTVVPQACMPAERAPR